MQPKVQYVGTFPFPKAACMFAALSALITKNYEFLAQNRREITKTFFLYIFLEASTKILNKISSRFGY